MTELQGVKENLGECARIFQYEPECLPEGKLAAVAKMDMADADLFLDGIENQ